MDGIEHTECRWFGVEEIKALPGLDIYFKEVMEKNENFDLIKRELKYKGKSWKECQSLTGKKGSDWPVIKKI